MTERSLQVVLALIGVANAAAGALALLAPHTFFDQVDYAIGKQFRMDCKIFLVMHVLKDSARNRTDASLQRGTVRDSLCDETRNFFIDDRITFLGHG